MFIKFIDKIWPLHPYKSKYFTELTRDQLRLLANVVEVTGSFKAAVIFFPGYSPRKLKYIYYFLICGYRCGAKTTHRFNPKLSENELRLIDAKVSRQKKPYRWKEIGKQFSYIKVTKLKAQYFSWKKVNRDPKPKLKKILTEQDRQTLIKLYQELKCWEKLAEFYPGYTPQQIRYYYQTNILDYQHNNLPIREAEYWTPERCELFQKLWTSERNLSVIRKAFPKSPAKLYAQAERMKIERLSALN